MLFASEELEKDAKRRFAKLYAQAPTFQNANEIAFTIFSDDEDVWKAVKIATDWPEDEEVLQLAQESKLRSFDDGELLRAKLVNSLLEILESGYIEPKDRVAAAKELRELQGLTVKNLPTGEGDGGLGFVYFPVAKDIGEWEQESMAHQGDLINKVFK